MSSVIRINRFVESANQTYSAPTDKYLYADPNGIDVCQRDLPKSFSYEAREQNKTTWNVFRESLINTLGKRKFDWICHRYRGKLNFTQMQRSGQPLLPEHVELFSVGASQVLARDVKARFPAKIKTFSRQELSDRIQHIQPFPLVGSYRDPLTISGSPGSLFAYFFHDKLLMDKEKQLLFSDVERLSFPAWQERFCKVTINRELIEGQLIPAPGQDGRIDYYKVYRKIGTGHGLVAYALKPAVSDSTLKPLVVFRPSQWAPSNEDAIETYLNDVQRNVGEMGWEAAKGSLKRLMSDPHFRRNNEKVSLAGYSLGGVHAQYFLAAHSANVAHAVFYNDPNADDYTAERFAKKMNGSPRRDEPLNIQIFRMKGDICHHIGGKHVGWGVDHPDVNIQLMELDHENKQIAAIYLHSHRIFDNATFPYQMQCYEDTEQLFNLLDSSKAGPDAFWYEKTRRLWGRVAFISFYGLSEVVKLISKLFGVKILRSSKTPEF